MGVGVLEAIERQGRTHRRACQADILGTRKGTPDGEIRVHIYKGRRAGPTNRTEFSQAQQTKGVVPSAWSQTAPLCVI